MDENKKKMLEGKIYDPFIGDLQKERINCHNLCLEYNQLKDLDPRKDEIIKILFPDSENLYLQGPIFFDFGTNTHFGKNCYANFNFTVVDICPIHIGDNVFFGPNVSLVNAVHPLLSEERKSTPRSQNTSRVATNLFWNTNPSKTTPTSTTIFTIPF